MKSDSKELALSFIDEIVEYFESMPVLTDDEEALLRSAEWIKEQINKKGK